MEPQALCTASVQFDLNLHPSTAANVMAAVQEQLNKLLLRQGTPALPPSVQLWEYVGCTAPLQRLDCSTSVQV